MQHVVYDIEVKDAVLLSFIFAGELMFFTRSDRVY